MSQSLSPRRPYDPVVLGLGLAALLVFGLLGVVGLVLTAKYPAQTAALSTMFALALGGVGTLAGGLLSSRYAKQATPDPPDGGRISVSVESAQLRREDVREQIEAARVRERRRTLPPFDPRELEDLEDPPTAPHRRQPPPVPASAGEYSVSARTLGYGEALAKRAEEEARVVPRQRKTTGAHRRGGGEPGPGEH